MGTNCIPTYLISCDQDIQNAQENPAAKSEPKVCFSNISQQFEDEYSLLSISSKLGGELWPVNPSVQSWLVQWRNLNSTPLAVWRDFQVLDYHLNRGTLTILFREQDQNRLCKISPDHSSITLYDETNTQIWEYDANDSGFIPNDEENLRFTALLNLIVRLHEYASIPEIAPAYDLVEAAYLYFNQNYFGATAAPHQSTNSLSEQSDLFKERYSKFVDLKMPQIDSTITIFDEETECVPLKVLSENNLSPEEQSKLQEAFNLIPNALISRLLRQDQFKSLTFEVVADDLMEQRMGPNVVALYADRTKHIGIQSSYLKKNSAESLSETLIHELGHFLEPKNKVSISNHYDENYQDQTPGHYPFVTPYSRYDAHEYFAEAVESYYSTQLFLSPPFGTTHGTNSRYELAQKDPLLFIALKLYLESDISSSVIQTFGSDVVFTDLGIKAIQKIITYHPHLLDESASAVELGEMFSWFYGN